MRDTNSPTHTSRQETTTGPTRSIEEIVRLGDEIYERDIRRLVEPDHDGEIYAIDVDSGDWVVDEDELVVEDRLKAKRPGAVNVYCGRVGYVALRNFGGGSSRRPA